MDTETKINEHGNARSKKTDQIPIQPNTQNNANALTPKYGGTYSAALLENANTPRLRRVINGERERAVKELYNHDSEERKICDQCLYVAFSPFFERE